MFKYGRAGKISIVRDEKDTMNYDRNISECISTYWGGDGAFSTTHVRDIVDPRTKWNSSDDPGLSMWALGVTTDIRKTKECGPFAEEIWGNRNIWNEN